MNTRIKQVRQLHHLTQDVFASRLGITKSSVSLIESGKNNPSEQTIRAICSEFGIRREWLEFGHEPMQAAEMVNTPEALVPDLMAILSDHPAILSMMQRMVGMMKPSDWDRLNQLMDSVADTAKEPPQP